MKKLSINEALNLYEVLEPYLPEEIDQDAIKFAGTIVNNIQEGQNKIDYLQAVSILLGASIQDIVTNLEPRDVVARFIEGLIENDFGNLVRFCGRLKNA